jgi:DNA-binding transcriptional regulator GbsR (MarR family)
VGNGLVLTDAQNLLDKRQSIRYNRKKPKQVKRMADLTPVMKKVILHWGEMGSTWGINRTVAQIYALLYLSPRPLTAEEISETLALARSTVSTGLRELQSWGIIRVVHMLGDRRDHFEAMSSVWEMFRTILEERKHREIDPTLALLRESVAELKDEDTSDARTKERLEEMLDLFELITTIYQQVEQVPTETLVRIAKLGDSLDRVLSRVAKG